MLLVLILAGCQGATTPTPKTQQPAQTSQTNQNQFEQTLAGGKLGYPCLAVVGGGQSNKLWVLDAKYHKLLTTIDVGGPKLDRTQP